MNTTNSLLDLNEVKSIVFNDIALLLDSFNLDYEQVADNIFMKCPIHEGSDNPHGVSISLTKQTWKCWTRGCHEHYKHDIFGLVKGLLQTDSFSEALRYISKLYNLKEVKTHGINNKHNNIDGGDDNFSTIIRSINRSKTKNRCSNLEIKRSESTNTGIISPYFLSRGYREETLRFFGVQEWDRHSTTHKNRAIIPIWFNSILVGYIARATKEWLQPKYIFSEGIKKSDYLYNYDNAIKYIANTHALFLVEGQGDVWRLWECGVHNAVGLFGKDISDTQKDLLLKSGATTLIILTDNDQAGRESKIKIKRDFGRLFNLIFPKMQSKDLGDMSNEAVQSDILINLKRYCQ
jgi:DNA primase